MDSRTPSELTLAGCRPEPLGSYLKALGVIRLVGNQADPLARCRWVSESFVLRTELDRSSLIAFFLDEYVPTPLVSPWNGGSGFGPKDRSVAIEAIERSDAARLTAYREAISVGRQLFEDKTRSDWDKPTLLEACRSRLPEGSIEWLDAAVALAEERPAFPPLLGTGGNDGRFEFSNNFMQRLVDVLSLGEGPRAPTRDDSRAWLEASLFADRRTRLLEAPVGQFDPGSAGGVNSAPQGAAESLVNPWDWVLLLEGALLFAGAVARLLSAGSRGRAAAPFTFDATPAGYAGASDESGRGEIWVPLWSRPATRTEIAHLIGEARSEWRGRPARRGIDMVRAVTSLGVDRGIDRFARFALLERFGRNTLAVAVGRVPVRAQPGVPVLAQLDRWVDAVRRTGSPPAGVSVALRRIDTAMWEVAVRGGARQLQDALASVAEAEQAVGRATGFRARANLRPVDGLRAADWIPHLDDGSPEFHIAASLASARDDGGYSLRHLLRPFRSDARGRADWTEGAEIVPGLGVLPIVNVLAAAHVRRAFAPPKDGQENDQATITSGVGVQTAFKWAVRTHWETVAAFVDGRVDNARLGRLLAALMLLDRWRGVRLVGGVDAHTEVGPPDPAWALLAPFFHGTTLTVEDVGQVLLRPEANWPALLAAARVPSVIDAALRRLRVAHLSPAPSSIDALASASPAGRCLSAALLVPLSRSSVLKLLARACPAPLEKEVRS